MKLSIIIPCFNEENTIRIIVEKVLKFNLFDKEIIIVDDCSTDKSREIIQELSKENSIIKYFFLEKNFGKGAAINKGFKEADGDIILIQDADLEYDPKDYSIIFNPFLEDGADVVYGTRFGSGKKVRIFYYINRVANFIITNLVNTLTNINFTDVETGYKAIKSKYLKNLNLIENSFTIEIEITMKISKIKPLKIFEVGISYSGRTYEEGKKIKMIDGIKAILAIFKYRFLS